MASNKDRIKNLEDAFGQLQDGIAEMKIDFSDKFQHLEDIVTILSDAVLSGKGGDNYKQAGSVAIHCEIPCAFIVSESSVRPINFVLSSFATVSFLVGISQYGAFDYILTCQGKSEETMNSAFVLGALCCFYEMDKNGGDVWVNGKKESSLGF
ncbi:hypothetical protein Tco_0066037 [Tanacetum coccineum]